MVKPGGKKTKGRQRVDMRRIENRESRQVTFSKRKSGLWKKASEIAVLCRALIAVVTFSEAGKAFAFGSPSVDKVLSRCVSVSGDVPLPAPDAAGLDEDHQEALVETCQATEDKTKEVAAEAARMKAIGEKVSQVLTQTGKRFWWEADVEALGVAELSEFAKALQRLRENVSRRADNLLSTARGSSGQAGTATLLLGIDGLN